MSYPNNVANQICSANQVNQVLAADPTRIYGPIKDALEIGCPYLKVMDMGAFPANISGTLQSVVQGVTATSQSLNNPTGTVFGNSYGICGAGQILSGTYVYNYNAYQTLEYSNPITLNTGFNAVASSLTKQLSAMQERVSEIINAINRYGLISNAGVAAVLQAGVQPLTMMYGGYGQYQLGIPTVAATANIDFETLSSINRIMRTKLRVQPFQGGGGNEGYACFIASPDALEKLRSDLGGAAGPGGGTYTAGQPQAFNALATGNNAMAQKAIQSFIFEPTYRGIKLMEDPTPNRYNFSGGAYVPVEPWINTAGTNGTVAVPNPAYDAAGYEAGILVYRNSFKRLTPEVWTGEGSVRFAKQLFGGQVQFVTDNIPNNLLKDFGVLIYKIAWAFEPIYPWAVCPVYFKRCVQNTITTCVGVTGL